MSDPEVIPDDSRASDSPVVSTFGQGGDGPICVVDGMGVSLRVDRHHLVVSDGIGKQRRERRYHRATHGLSRIVILGSTGTLSLDALRYCDRLGIAVVVIDPASLRPSFVSFPKGIDDARLRRVQAKAPDGELGMEISRTLIGAKLDGQADLLRSMLAMEEPAMTITSVREALATCTTVDEARQLEATAAACYFNAWMGSERTVPRFASRDLSKLPDHWLRFEGRRSRLGAVKGNRKAERPVNALLNYLFALVEVEAVLACHRVGLDPGLGICHLDAKDRASMALDCLEPVRPAVEAWTLELLTKRTFKRSDFAETADGHVRILAPLTHELADTMGHWRKLIGPWVERVSHLLGDAVTGKYTPTTPLTRGNSLRAQASVIARSKRTYANGRLAQRATIRNPRQMAAEPSVKVPTCVDCGGKLARGRHVRCPGCWEMVEGQDAVTRARRGAAISESQQALIRWREEHPGEAGDPEVFQRTIMPGLAGVKLSEIMAACGVSKSTASMVRSGKHRPALRHWEALSALARKG